MVIRITVGSARAHTDVGVPHSSVVRARAAVVGVGSGVGGGRGVAQACHRRDRTIVRPRVRSVPRRSIGKRDRRRVATGRLAVGGGDHPLCRRRGLEHIVVGRVVGHPARKLFQAQIVLSLLFLKKINFGEKFRKKHQY